MVSGLSQHQLGDCVHGVAGRTLREEDYWPMVKSKSKSRRALSIDVGVGMQGMMYDSIWDFGITKSTPPMAKVILLQKLDAGVDSVV